MDFLGANVLKLNFAISNIYAIPLHRISLSFNSSIPFLDSFFEVQLWPWKKQQCVSKHTSYLTGQHPNFTRFYSLPYGTIAD